MSSVRVEVDIDQHDVLGEMSDAEIREYLGPDPRPEYDLGDPIVRLGVITELRKAGYTVGAHS